MPIPIADQTRATERQRWDEAERLAELRALRILDTEPDRAYDDLARIAALVCAAPVSLIGFVDAERQWFKAEIGYGERETGIDRSVCVHALHADDLFVIEDLTLDRRTCDNPAVRAEGGFRFYAAAVIRSRTGAPIGTMCVLDRLARPKGLTQAQGETLSALARQISTLVEHRRTLADVDARETELAASERRFRVMTSAVPQMVWTTLPDGFHDFYNDRWYAYTGVPYGSTDGEAWNGMLHPDDREEARRRWRHSLETGTPYEVEYRLRHHSGVYRWALGRAVPIRGADGRIERWFGTCTDIDDLKQAVADARKLAAVVETSKDFIGLASEDGQIAHLNEAALALVGLSDLDAARRTAIPDYFTADSRKIFEDVVMPTLRRDGWWEGELAFRHFATGDAIAVLFTAFTVRDAVGNEAGYGTVSRDLRDAKRAEEARDLLIKELSHRIKNIFAVVGGIAALSARTDPAARPFAKVFRERLGALAQAHEYVRPHSPESAPRTGGQTVLGLMRLIMSAYVEDERCRVAIDGDDVAIGERTATALALIMHEQATNAVKYGALSNEAGTVTLTGLRTETCYRLTWAERGGPPVLAPPSRKGFGTELAERSVTGQLDGALEHDWAPGGLVLRLDVPAENLRF